MSRAKAAIKIEIPVITCTSQRTSSADSAKLLTLGCLVMKRRRNCAVPLYAPCRAEPASRLQILRLVATLARLRGIIPRTKDSKFFSRFPCPVSARYSLKVLHARQYHATAEMKQVIQAVKTNADRT